MKTISTLITVLCLFIVLGPVQGCSDDEAPTLTFSPDSLPAARNGEAYNVTITISGQESAVYTIELSSGELPSGLSLEYSGSNTASIQGTPTETGSFTFTILAACYGTNKSGQTDSKQYTLVVE